MATLANMHPGLGRFEPCALAPISSRPTTARTDGAFAAWVAASPVEALVAQFPVIRRLVGDESLRAMACRFIESEPPRSSTSMHCGEVFPRFLRGLGRAASIEYVADVAELESAWARARWVTDASPVDPQAVCSAWTKSRGDVRVALHASVSLIASRFPIVTIWRSNRRPGETLMIDRWRAECALVARPFDEVEVRCLPRGGFAFMSSLAEGYPIAMAIEAGKAAVSDFDIACNLALLGEANIVVGFRNKDIVS